MRSPLSLFLALLLLLLLPSVTSAAALPGSDTHLSQPGEHHHRQQRGQPPSAPPVLEQRAVSPNKTCGASQPGAYTCPADATCCSQYGYCGATEPFCLTTAGCQARYSNTSAACYAPRPGVSVTIDGTCGSAGAGKNGYRCAGNATVVSCCSAA